MIETKHKLSDQECVLLPVAHGSGGFVHMRAVPARAATATEPTAKGAAKSAKKLEWPLFFPSCQFGAQMPRTPQMQSGATSSNDRQMGD